jgi:hypothetical protein
MGFKSMVKYQEGITSSVIEKIESDIKLLDMYEKQAMLGIITKPELISKVLNITVEQAKDKIKELQKGYDFSYMIK